MCIRDSFNIVVAVSRAGNSRHGNMIGEYVYIIRVFAQDSVHNLTGNNDGVSRWHGGVCGSVVCRAVTVSSTWKNTTFCIDWFWLFPPRHNVSADHEVFKPKTTFGVERTKTNFRNKLVQREFISYHKSNWTSREILFYGKRLKRALIMLNWTAVKFAIKRKVNK